MEQLKFKFYEEDDVEPPVIFDTKIKKKLAAQMSEAIIEVFRKGEKKRNEKSKY